MNKKVIITIVFVLTIISMGFAGYYVPSLERERQKNLNLTDNLRNVFFIENQKFGRNSLNMEASANILASAKIIKILKPDRHEYTKQSLLNLGYNSVNKAMHIRLESIKTCITEISTIENPRILADSLPSVPEEDIKNLFLKFDESEIETIKKMRKYVENIINVDQEYEKAWNILSAQINRNILEIDKINKILNNKISFYLKISLNFQMIALLLILIKDIKS